MSPRENNGDLERGRRRRNWARTRSEREILSHPVSNSRRRTGRGAQVSVTIAAVLGTFLARSRRHELESQEPQPIQGVIYGARQGQRHPLSPGAEPATYRPRHGARPAEQGSPGPPARRRAGAFPAAPADRCPADGTFEIPGRVSTQRLRTVTSGARRLPDSRVS